MWLIRRATPKGTDDDFVIALLGGVPVIPAKCLGNMVKVAYQDGYEAGVDTAARSGQLV